MASRRHVRSVHDEHIMPTHGIKHSETRHALPHPVEQHPLALLEKELASQAVEIEQLIGDNKKLAFSRISLRQDLAAAQQDVEKLQEHIRSIQTEGEIQIRILLDKIGKKEEDVRAGDLIMKELQEAHLEAQSLVKNRLELTARIQLASEELEEACDDIKKLPEMHSELEKLRQEHQRLRKVFEHEKGANIEKVEEMKIMEKELIRMAEEGERLRAEVSNADNKAPALSPYGISHINMNYTFPAPFHGNGCYVGGYGIPFPQMAVAVEGSNAIPVAQFACYPPTGGDPSAGAVGFPAWGVAYDASHIHM